MKTDVSIKFNSIEEFLKDQDMKVYVLELAHVEDYTNYEQKGIVAIFNSYEKAFSYMQEMCNKENITVTKDEYDFYNCDKPFYLDASCFAIESYIVN